MSIYKPVSSEPSMDSIVYENKKKFLFQTSEVNEFAVVFYHCIAAMYGIESQKTLSLLYELCRHAQLDIGIVEVSANIRRCICKDADINITNFSKHMNVLKEAGLIKDRGGCSYLVNPQAFWGSNPKQEDCTFYVEFGIKRSIEAKEAAIPEYLKTNAILTDCVETIHSQSLSTRTKPCPCAGSRTQRKVKN